MSLRERVYRPHGTAEPNRIASLRERVYGGPQPVPSPAPNADDFRFAPYADELKRQDVYFRPVDPSDPQAQSPPRIEDRRIGLIEQVTRMDAVDWLERAPFSPAGAIRSAELYAAGERLKKNDYSLPGTTQLDERMAEWAKEKGLAEPVSVHRPDWDPEAERRKDLALVESYLLEQQEVAERGQTWGAKVFDGASYLPAWMIEFALTGGLAQLGSTGAKEIGLKTLRGYAKTKAGRAVLSAAGWTGGVITRASLGMPHRLADQILDQRVRGLTLKGGQVIDVNPDSPTTSILKGYGAHMIEVGSETAGEAIAAGAKRLTQATIGRLPFASRLYEAMRTEWLKMHPAGGSQFANRFFDAAKWDGFLAEYGEERLTTILHAVTGTHDFGLGPDSTPFDRLKRGLSDDLANIHVEAAVLAVPGAAKLATGAVGAKGRSDIQSALVQMRKTLSAEKIAARAQQVEPDILRDVARDIGVPVEGGGIEGLRSRVAARIAELTKTEPRPPLEGQGHPGSLPYEQFSELYGRELAKQQSPWLERYAEGAEKPRQMYKRLREEYRAAKAWETLYDWAPAVAESDPVEIQKVVDMVAERPEVAVLAEGAAAEVETKKKPWEKEETEMDIGMYRVDRYTRTPMTWKESLDEVRLMGGKADLSAPVDASGAWGLAETPAGLFLERTFRLPSGNGVSAAVMPITGEAAALYGQAVKADAKGERGKAASLRKQALARAWSEFQQRQQGPANAIESQAAGVPPAPTVAESAPVAAEAETPPVRPSESREGEPAPEVGREAVRQETAATAKPETVAFTDAEVVRHNQDRAADETTAAVYDYFGVLAAADATIPEPTEADIGWLKTIYTKLTHGDVEILSDKDFRDIYKFIQLPNDIARSFPQFRPLVEIQRAREEQKQALDRHFGDKLQPYFDLTRAEQLEVDRVLVMMEQNLTGVQSHIDALSAEQRKGYEAVRLSLDEAAEMLVQYMEKLGVRQEWIDEFRGRIGFYVPHKWYGKYRVIAKDARDKTIEIAAADRKGDVQTELDRLKQAYPQAKVFAVEARKMPFDAYQDVSFQGIVQMIDRVVEKANQDLGKQRSLTDSQKQVLNEAWTDLWKEKGFGMHFIQRQEVPGWTEDLRKPLLEYFSGFTGYLTKMQACQQFPEGLAQIDASRTPSLYRYASEYVRYLTGDDSAGAVTRPIKNALFHAYLYGNLKSAAVNLTQNHVLGWPVLSKLTNWPLAKMLYHQARTTAGRLTDGEKAFLSQLETSGALDPKFATELKDFGGNPIYRAAWKKGQKVYNFADVFTKAEQFNRRAMAVALYNADPTLRTDLKRTSELIEEAHFRFSKGNRPQLWRGYLSPLMTFRSYTLNYLTWLKNEVKAGRIGPAARSMAALTFYGGLKATPFAAPLLLLWRKVWNTDPEADIRAAFGDLAESVSIDPATGERVADMLMRGAPSVLGISLTGSIAMNDIIPRFSPDVDREEAVRDWMLGVMGSIPQRVNRISASLRAGDRLRAVEDAAPEFLRNPLAAWRMYSQGSATRSGRPIIDHEFHQQMKLTEYEAIVKALGFQPDRLAKQYQIKAYLDEIYARKQAMKAQWADRLVLSAKTGDGDGVTEVLDEIEAYNRKMERRGREDLTIKGSELEQMLSTRLQPVGLPAESMLGTYERIWKQYYGRSPKKPQRQ